VKRKARKKAGTQAGALPKVSLRGPAVDAYRSWISVPDWRDSSAYENQLVDRCSGGGWNFFVRQERSENN
jgi:hypothetical protein